MSKESKHSHECRAGSQKLPCGLCAPWREMLPRSAGRGDKQNVTWLEFARVVIGATAASHAVCCTSTRRRPTELSKTTKASGMRRTNSMCGPTDSIQAERSRDSMKESRLKDELPVETLLDPPSLVARYSCAGILVAVFAVWAKYTFVGEDQSPGVTTNVHDYKAPLALTAGYLVSLPLLKLLAKNYLSKTVDAKLLLTESMVLYNVGQVLLNAWMVYKFIAALIGGHPFVGDIHSTTATYAVWVHYCDKYLEFLDTYFMVLRGKMDQVSFLHIYHHATIAWAWWAGISLWPGGDAYFGALLNSWIHVMMYSYYALSLLKIQCPWKKYLTQAQLLQFASVLVYSWFSFRGLPEEANWKHYSALIIQDAEMISLFVLFMHFYNKAYNKRKSAKKEVECSESDASSETEQVSVSSAGTDDAAS